MYPFGVDYYPEHWPCERWPEDTRLMADAGVNVVRLAEFAWSLLEPEPGRFDFDWLDRAIDVLAGDGIQVILGTPTASPPPWVMALLPQAYRVDETGRRLTYGNRREYCPNHKRYRERGRLVTAAMAAHYHAHPAVIGWQIDNELGKRCYCPLCQAGFQDWLRLHYGSLDELNAAWGTAFWSHVYDDWAQIPVPLETGGVPNPGLDLDYRRFMSDSFISFQAEQVAILREACPTHFITHNFMGFKFDQIDYFGLAEPLDFVAWDNYPRTSWFLKPEVDPASIALGHDATRSFKRAPFWLMEQQSGSGGWQTLGITPRPGEMRLWTYQAVAHGADGMLYFRWRTARYGTEQYWHGVLPHHGQPGRRYAEFQQIGQELNRLGPRLLGAENRNRVAMLLSYDSRWAFQGQANHADFNYAALFVSYYRALHHRNIGVDIVSPHADLSPYKLLVAPALYVLDDDTATRLVEFVQGGGILVTTARSGVKDQANAVVNAALPGLLSEVCGMWVEEYDVLPVERAENVWLDLPGWERVAVQAHLWVDVLRPVTARVVGSYASGHLSGSPAVTLNRHGKGQALYVGALGGDQYHDALISWALEASHILPAHASPPGVEVTVRWQGDQPFLFVLNHTLEPQEVALDGAYQDLIRGEVVAHSFSIPSLEVYVLTPAP